MIDRAHHLPITKQAAALNIIRGSVYYLDRPVLAADLALMRRIVELHLEFPFSGSRLSRSAGCRGSKIGRRHVTTLMKRMGIAIAILARRVGDGYHLHPDGAWLRMICE
jgi:putative transposase